MCLGLALTAVHNSELAAIVPSALFSSDTTSSAISGIVNGIAGLNVQEPTKNSKTSQRIHALTILARLAKDSSVQIQVKNSSKDAIMGIFGHVMTDFSDPLNKYAEDWSNTIDLNNRTAINAKVNELTWMNVVIYGICGWNRGGTFNSDFFLFVPFLTSGARKSNILLVCTSSPRPYSFHRS